MPVSLLPPHVEQEKKIHIGDFVSRAGIYTKPGVVTEKKPNGDIVVDTDPAMIEKYHKYTVTTGLTVEEKEKFNQIMSSVMALEDNGDKLNALQQSIDELKRDPASKKVAVTLHNQQAELIRLARELPRVYQIQAPPPFRA